MRPRLLAVGAQGPTSPAFRIRASLLRDPLAAYGIELDLHPLFDADGEAAFRRGRPATRARVLLRARRRTRAVLREHRDGVLVQRQVDMFPTLELERRAAATGRLVLDVDDAIWHDRSRAAGGSVLTRLKCSARRVRWLAQRADAMIAGNELLAEWLAPHGGPVSVIPSLVDVQASPVRSHTDADDVVLGWIGSTTTAAYLESLAEPLRRATLELAGQRRLHVVVMGGASLQGDGIEVLHVPWSEDAERELLGRMDIGLMPLPDTAWTRGKCAYKAVQYMAAGVPVVADDVGISAATIGDRHGGLIVAGADEWTEAILALASDAGLRQRLGSEGRRRADEGFSTRRWVPKLAGILAGGASVQPQATVLGCHQGRS